MPIARKDGTLCRSAAEELDRWSEHYGTALNHPTAGPHEGIDRLAAFTPSEDGVKTDAPTVEEVAKAVGKLKKRKSAGSDGITAELLKYSIDSVVPALHRLFCRVWTRVCRMEGRHHCLTV